jgi:hypothetical protein
MRVLALTFWHSDTAGTKGRMDFSTVVMPSDLLGSWSSTWRTPELDFCFIF